VGVDSSLALVRERDMHKGVKVNQLRKRRLGQQFEKAAEPVAIVSGGRAMAEFG
jgi:hypothetical protein